MAKTRSRKGPSTDANDPVVELKILRRLQAVGPVPRKEFHQRARHILKCGLIASLMSELEQRGLVSCTRKDYRLTKWGLTAAETGQAALL